MDGTNFSDDARDDLYIDEIVEADEAAHGDGSNTPSDESYGYMMVEERSDQDGIYDAAYK